MDLDLMGKVLIGRKFTKAELDLLKRFEDSSREFSKRYILDGYGNPQH
jgi:hypothetical protein